MTAPVFPVMTVPVEPCCGVLVGEYHECPAFAAEVYAAFANPIELPTRTDPALDVWRPGPDMVEAMCPPLRWQVSDDTVSVHLGVDR